MPSVSFFFFFFMPSVSKSAALYSQKLHLIQGTRACLLLISCPSPHASTDLDSQEIFHRGWTLSFPKEQIKRPKSACPHRVGIWQRFEVALRHHREWLQITLSAQSASKPFAGLSHPRERLHSASSMHNRAGPWQDGEELAIPYGPWFVASTWRGRNNDSNNPSSPTNRTPLRTSVTISTTDTKSDITLCCRKWEETHFVANGRFPCLSDEHGERPLMVTSTPSSLCAANAEKEPYLHLKSFCFCLVLLFQPQSSLWYLSRILTQWHPSLTSCLDDGCTPSYQKGLCKLWEEFLTKRTITGPSLLSGYKKPLLSHKSGFPSGSVVQW